MSTNAKSVGFTQVAFWCSADIISDVKIIFWLLKTAETLTLWPINDTLISTYELQCSPNTHCDTQDCILRRM